MLYGLVYYRCLSNVCRLYACCLVDHQDDFFAILFGGSGVRESEGAGAECSVCSEKEHSPPQEHIPLPALHCLDDAERLTLGDGVTALRVGESASPVTESRSRSTEGSAHSLKLRPH